MAQERYHIENMRRAYEQGKADKLASKPLDKCIGFGYSRGKYYGWFFMGYNGQPFVDFYDPYARVKASTLLNAEARRYPNLSIPELAILSFARYISSRE